MKPPDGSGSPHRSRPDLGWRLRLEALQRSILRRPRVLAVRDVMRAYDQSGGAMLSAALSYFAFFTLVPSLLLFVSVLGLLVESSDLRAELIAGLVDRIGPIRDVATAVIDGLSGSGRTGTIIGVLGLLWGASGFYGALQDALQRMFPGPTSRGLLPTRIRGVLTVVLILGSMLAAVVLVFAVPIISEWLTAGCRTRTGSPLPLVAQACDVDFGTIGAAVAVVATMAVAFLAALAVYVMVPSHGATFRQAFWPALIVGLLIGAFTSLFGWVAPLLVRQWVALGIVGSVFIALVWLNLLFQALIYGAAWARLNRDRDRRSVLSL
jgi:membrane protein